MKKIYTPVIGYMDTMKAQRTFQLTKERFNKILKSENVRKIVLEDIPAVQNDDTLSDKEKEQKIRELKLKLPGFIFMAHCMENGEQPTIATAVPTGLCIHDFDKMPFDVKSFYTLNVEPFLEQLGALLVHITPSGKGLRLVTKLAPGETIVECQKRMAKFLQMEAKKDEKVKNISRGSYAFPEEYLLFLDDALFSLPPYSINVREEETVNETPDSTSVQTTPTEATAIVSQLLPKSESYATSELTAYAEAMKFEGVAMKDIIEALFERMCGGGVPVEGNRNDTLYKMAREIRPITMSDFQYTYKLLAGTFSKLGLSDQEIRQTISSAVTREGGYTRNLSPMLQSVVNSLKGNARQTAPQVILPYDLLPPLMKSILDCYPQRDHVLVLLAMLPMFGTWGTGVRFENGEGRMNSLEFLTVFVGEFGCGKGFLKHLNEMIMGELRKHDREARDKAEAERQERDAMKNTNERLVKNSYPVRNFASNITLAQIIIRLNELKGRHGLLCSEELSTLLNSIDSNYGSGVADVVKAAFDNSEYSKETSSDHTPNIVLDVYLNLCFSCTYNILQRLFSDKNVDDGTASRFLIGELEDSLMFNVPKYKKLSKSDRKKLDTFLYKLAAVGADSEDGTKVVRSDALKTAMEGYIEEQIAIYSEGGDREFRVLANRAAVYGIRFGMMLWYMWGCPAGMANGKTDAKHNPKMQKIIDFALWFAHYVQNQQYRFISKQMLKSNNNSTLNLRPSYQQVNILSLLPTIFDVKEFVAMKLNITGRKDQNPHQSLLRLADKGLVAKHPDGKHWQKTA